ncbi:hypothetical protein RI129_011079 [Pyrocoelia pectoralis]|uniref:THAP-type domain-containing protein n=1 Tax=Pyrocoelia pectoralis TaxID=417401 RepID=A0AAN7ZIH0_9COLE
MVMCFVPDCKHYSERRTCSYYRFPKDLGLKNKWLKLIRREGKTPTAYSMVCSCHFINGDKKNLPTLYDRNIKKVFTFHSPEKKRKRYVLLYICDTT